MEFDQIFAYALTITTARLGLLYVDFRKSTTELWLLVIVKNFVYTQYILNELVEFDQILH